MSIHHGITTVFIAVSALMTASCGKTSIPQDTAGGISFMTSVGTRAIVEDDAYLRDGGLGIYAVMLPQPDNAELFFNNVHLEYSDSEGWSYTPPQYWISGYEYCFWAIHPYMESPQSIAATSGSLSVTGYELTRENLRTDFMIGAAYRDQRQSVDLSPVPIVLGHAMASLDFRIRNGSGRTVKEINDLSFTGMKSKCDMTMTAASEEFPHGTLSVSSDSYQIQTGQSPYSDELPMVLPEGGMPDDLTTYYTLYREGAFLAVPQRVAGGGNTSRNISLSFTVVYADGSSQYCEVNLSSNTTSETEYWEAGNKYTYNITLTEERITFEVTVIDWIDDIIPLD